MKFHEARIHKLRESLISPATIVGLVGVAMSAIVVEVGTSSDYSAQLREHSALVTGHLYEPGDSTGIQTLTPPEFDLLVSQYQPNQGDRDRYGNVHFTVQVPKAVYENAHNGQTIVPTPTEIENSSPNS